MRYHGSQSFVALLTVAAITLVLSACGGGDGGSPQSPYTGYLAKAQCAPGDLTETGLQGQVPMADRRMTRDGLGLVGIRERVEDLGGRFRIEGKSGKGTRLTIELPLAARG